MIATTLAEVAAVTGGRLVDADPATVVTGPAFLDSRQVEPGGLFVAFAGERVDGHDFATGAVGAGAAAVLGSRPTGVPTVVVDDVQGALQRLASEVLRRRRREGAEGAAPPPGRDDLVVIGITGSQGKTSVKDMLGRVLADAAPTVATAGSFNNEIGLPLTVLRVEADTRFLVLEMGARGIGHIAELCAIAPPDVAVVLNVGKAHLGEFGSRANIALAKGELVEAARRTAVLNADDALVMGMTSRGGATAYTFGTTDASDLRLAHVELDDLGRPSFDLVRGDDAVHVSLRLIGEHQALNAAAVAASAVAAGLDLQPVAESLGALESLSRWRMELHERGDGLVVVNDAYNANPDSTASALRTLAWIGERSGRRTVAVLGEMRELGADAEAEHRAIGDLATRLGVGVVVTVGEGARSIGATRHVATVEEATAWLGENVGGSDVVLVKASRAAALERVAQALLDDARRQGTTRESTTHDRGEGTGA